jgi:hypothetical protein
MKMTEIALGVALILTLLTGYLDNCKTVEQVSRAYVTSYAKEAYSVIAEIEAGGR